MIVQNTVTAVTATKTPVQLNRRGRRPKVPAQAPDTQTTQVGSQVNFNNNLNNNEIPVPSPAILTQAQANYVPLTSSVNFQNFMEMIVARVRAQLANEHTDRSSNETGTGGSWTRTI